MKKALLSLAVLFIFSGCEMKLSGNLITSSSETIPADKERSIASGEVSSFPFQVPCATGDIVKNDRLCVNGDLPLAPSIRRFLGKAGISETFPSTIPISGVEDRYDLNNPNHVYKVFPYSRPSLDGRLFIGSDNNWTNFPQGSPNSIPDLGGLTPMLTYFDPEHVGYDQKIHKANPLVTSAPIHPIVYLTFNPKRTFLDYSSFRKNEIPGTYHLDFCHDQAAQEDSNPRACKAYVNSSYQTTVSGDCYDVTILAFTAVGNKNEIRTVPVTIFVKNAKMDGNVEEIVTYPRQLTGILSDISEMRNLANVGDHSDMNKSNIKFLTDQCLNANGDPLGGNVPKYCQFIYAQKRFTSINVIGKKKNYPDGPPFFEPSISGDGKLIYVNFGLGSGLHYSYNSTKSLCDPAGWKDFYPISNMPFDKNIYENYPIGKAQRKRVSITPKIFAYVSVPFLDGMGNPIPQNQNVEGAYLWGDRQVKNVFFNVVNVVQDNFVGVKDAACLAMDPACVIDAAPGKGLHVLGAWTKGRMIHLDGVANMFDFGFRPFKSADQERVFEMKLYKDEITTLRPSAMTVIGSLENKLNHYDALSPVSPFDVVWNLSSNNERTGEVIFDDYLSKFVFIGTHFNQSTTPFAYNGGHITLFKNGYVPQSNYLSGDPGTKSNFQLKEIPLVQNFTGNMKMLDNSTADLNLQILGGARVEPVAQGGVFGKGLFLDGKNDSAALNVNVKRAGSAWLLTLWIDPRTLDTQERIIFGFPDYSSIAITKDNFVAKNCKGSTCTVKKIPFPKSLVKVGKFFHLSLKIETIANPYEDPQFNAYAKLRRLTFYINGTQLIHNMVYQGSTYKKKFLDFGIDSTSKHGFDFFNNSQPGVFSVGRQNLLNYESALHGWIDELRVFMFVTSRADSLPKVPTFYDEILCNEAFGSLLKVYPNDSSNPALSKVFNTAKDLNHFLSLAPAGPNDKRPPTRNPLDSDYVLQTNVDSTLVCEQLKLESYNSASDFADQRTDQNLICADKVHTNPHPSLSSRCMHKTVLELVGKDLKAGQPRPEFKDVKFCLFCHLSGDFFPPLSTDALLKIDINREMDNRRQPLDVVQTTSGCVPTESVFGSNAGQCPPTRIWLDFTFDFNKKITPK